MSEILAFSRVSSGKSAPFELTWVAPSDCPESGQVRAELARLVAIGEPTVRQLRADALVEHADSSEYILTLRTELDGHAGERILRGHSCAMLSDAAVLTLALMLNPDTELEHAAPTKTAPLPIATSSGTLRLLPAARFELGERTRSLTLQILGQGGLATGVLPRIGPELGFGIHAASRHASLGLEIDFGPPQHRALPGTASMGGKLWTGSLSLVGCWMLRGQMLAAGPCAGGAVTRLEGTGYGVRHPQEGAVSWFSPLVAGRIDLQLQAQFSLRLMFTALVPVDRPSVYLEDLGELHRPSVVGGRAQIGAVFDLR